MKRGREKRERRESGKRERRERREEREERDRKERGEGKETLKKGTLAGAAEGASRSRRQSMPSLSDDIKRGALPNKS